MVNCKIDNGYFHGLFFLFCWEVVLIFVSVMYNLTKKYHHTQYISHPPSCNTVQMTFLHAKITHNNYDKGSFLY